MIPISQAAPVWAQQMARDYSAAIEAASLGVFASLKVFDAAGTLPDPAKNTNKIVLLSNGTFWLAKSDGTGWIYPDMSAV